jgi:integrase
VYIPEALARKIPSAAEGWSWQYVFPSGKLSKNPGSGVLRRHHVYESGLQKAIKRAAARVGLTKPVGTHTMRHAFATNLLENGYDIRTVQEPLGHADVPTTMICKRSDPPRHPGMDCRDPDAMGGKSRGGSERLR